MNRALFSLLFFLGLGGLGGLAVLPLTGCASTQRNAYRTVGITTVTVDHAMQAWAEFVNAGHADPAQIDAVRSAYAKYFAAMNVAIDIGKSAATAPDADTTALATALTLAADAQANLLNLIQQFLPPEKAAALKGGVR